MDKYPYSKSFIIMTMNFIEGLESLVKTLFADKWSVMPHDTDKDTSVGRPDVRFDLEEIVCPVKGCALCHEFTL